MLITEKIIFVLKKMLISQVEYMKRIDILPLVFGTQICNLHKENLQNL